MSENINEARRLLRKEAKKLGAELQKNRTRTRAPVMRRYHEVQQMLSPLYGYMSQAGQDRVVDTVLEHKRGGTFVDVGGYDGVTGSNTFFLETDRGWTGALIEPVRTQIERAEVNRSCPCVEVAIAASEGEADFIEITEGYTQMSGLVDSYDKALLGQVRNDKRHKENVIKVKTITLSGILHQMDLVNPDFISLDIEGGEIECLKSFPFEKHDVKIWSIENNTGTPQIKQIMDENGYDLIEFCGPDEMYFKRSPQA
ncbi:FkbM family methyltransferase [Octadecabacter sp. 1_MG-2023]|uniref:FkbM family methyltransferase n=1 Tax=unclassified Octadecabacter TaxID=196158 RepID=UPI001C0A25C1|nr:MULTISPECIES: FkbM family methyltransferase [unclassified Octadecabacter]MBU2992363.1 FkbM family methyltransferase [Octadecabacter sp. B2R22]MDO6734880.1 FkbM family methyltransferase [Octadecabacter sp. 1_MG-2023]